MTASNASGAPRRTGLFAPAGAASSAPALVVAALALLGTVSGCAFVEFEESPYTVRELQLVYSAQEALTFFSWKLGAEADPDRVRFELTLEGVTRTLDLAEAPFPAEPWRCAGGLCFQYQVPGRVDLAPGDRPLTSVHADQGVFAGPPADFRAVERTFDVVPFPYGRNDRLELALDDWFEARQVPLRRAFEWQLVPDEGACGEPGPDWRIHQTHVGIDRGWTRAPHCVALRPVRADRPSVHVAVPIEPTAETRREPRRWTPPEAQAPIVYGLVFDLQIPDPGRCAGVQEGMAELIGAALESRGTTWRLGPYRPLDADGDPLDGCAQQPRRHLPVAEMIEAVQALRDDLVEPFRVIWFHHHNLALPPSEDVIRDVGLLLAGTAEAAGAEPAVVAVAPSSAAAGLPIAAFIDWRPVSDETLAADLAVFARDTVPFRTQLHDAGTEVPIPPPPGTEPPEAFKICQPVPEIDGMGAGPGRTVPWPAVLPWPDPGEPHFTIALGPQEMVPYGQYEVREVGYVLEACEAFCDQPFRLEDRTILPSWRADARCRRIEEGER